MKKLTIAFCGALLVSSAAAAALAQGTVWSLDARITETIRALDKGVADGAITRPEYYNSTHGVHEVQAHEREWLKAHGGHLDPATEHQFDGDLDNIINGVHWVRPEWHHPW